MTNAALINTLIALDERLTALGFSVGDPTIDAKVDAIVAGMNAISAELNRRWAAAQ